MKKIIAALIATCVLFTPVLAAPDQNAEDSPPLAQEPFKCFPMETVINIFKQNGQKILFVGQGDNGDTIVALNVKEKTWSVLFVPKTLGGQAACVMNWGQEHYHLVTPGDNT